MQKLNKINKLDLNVPGGNLLEDTGASTAGR